MIWNGKTWEIFLKLCYFRNQFVVFAALLIVNVIFLHNLKMQYGPGYKRLSWYISGLQSVGFSIGNVECGPEIEYAEGGGGGKKVSFTAYSSCRLQLLHIILVWLNHIQTFLKRNIFESSIIYLHFNCLLSVHVFVHEAIHHTELNIYFNNQHVLINAPHNINTGAQSSNT